LGIPVANVAAGSRGVFERVEIHEANRHAAPEPTIFPISMSSPALHISRGFEGIIQGAALPDLIQMECLAMTTRAVRIVRGNRMGRIFFAGGQIVHSELGDLTGEPALFDLLSWTGGSFEVEDGVRPMDETITRDWHGLVIEAAHLADERAARDGVPAATTATHMTSIPIMPISVTDIFQEPDVIKAVHFTEDGSLLSSRADDPETLQATFAYVTQLARLIGGALGAEGLLEVQANASEHKSLCLVGDDETIAMVTSAKANLANLAKKLA
jgi:hypothetical protein